MSHLNLIFHLPPLWLPESKTLALELSAEGEKVLCLIPGEELHRRYKARPDLDGTEAVALFDTFREEIETEIRSLLEASWPPPDDGQHRSPRVLHLGATSEHWCLPSTLAAEARG